MIYARNRGRVPGARGAAAGRADFLCLRVFFPPVHALFSRAESPCSFRAPVIAFFSAKQPLKLHEMKNHESSAVIFGHISYLY